LTIYYLELKDPSQLRPPSKVVEGFEATRAWIPYGVLNRFFYKEVGAAWQWTSRLPWTEGEWQAYAERAGLETWVGYLRGTPAGYFELARQDGAQAEIAMFGLLPLFIGRGVGGAMLTAAIRRAWEEGTQRVWLHTETADHPHALGNYQARGMQIYRTEAQ
jgi:ribosomal protein S18 acetylase RimI-like enzyme